MSGHIVVVGASLAGSAAAETLREKGFAGRITVVGDEPHAPYNRPPLSKDVILGRYGAADTDLPRPRTRKDPSVTWRLGVAATGLDTKARKLALADGTDVSYDRILLATGTRARPWPDETEAAFEGLLTLRGRDDAERVRSLLDAEPRRVVVVGGGFMGSELAAACRQRGLEVTLVDRGPAPLASALGATLARSAAEMHRRNGVDLRCDRSVKEVRDEGSGRVRAVVLDDGGTIEADVVLAALGAIPNTEWLAGSNVGAGPQGIACDASCRAFSTDMMVLDDVYVAGDVARFFHPMSRGRLVRLEHWDNAVQMAWIAAHNMICAPADRRAHLPIPAFWSAQYDTNIKSLGILADADEVVLTEGSLDANAFTAVYGRDKRVVGVVAFNGGMTLPAYERLLSHGSAFPPAIVTNNPPDRTEVMPAGFRKVHASPDETYAVLEGASFTERNLRWAHPAEAK